MVTQTNTLLTTLPPKFATSAVRKAKIVYLPKVADDPTQRKADITTAKREIDWEPKVTVDEGLEKTIEYFKGEVEAAGEIIPTGPDAVKPKGGK